MPLCLLVHRWLTFFNLWFQRTTFLEKFCGLSRFSRFFFSFWELIKPGQCYKLPKPEWVSLCRREGGSGGPVLTCLAGSQSSLRKHGVLCSDDCLTDGLGAGASVSLVMLSALVILNKETSLLSGLFVSAGKPACSFSAVRMGTTLNPAFTLLHVT